MSVERLRETTDHLKEVLVIASDGRFSDEYLGIVVRAKAKRLALAPDAITLLADAEEAMLDLLEIAAIAMPDSYFATDSRVVAAREVLARLDALCGDER